MKVKVLSIGLGGVGVIANYTLQNFKLEVETTAIIRSDFDQVLAQGYSISSIDYGGRRINKGPDEAGNRVEGYRPHHIVKSLAAARQLGPFDYIVVSTKVVPQTEGNIWDEIGEETGLFLGEKRTSVVLLQNGIDPERYWSRLREKVTLISGVSYISSVNNKGFVTQYGHDRVKFGLFYPEDAIELLQRFVELYSNEFNSVTLDANVKLTRWKKLLYNASLNTVCCLTNSDVGQVFQLQTSLGLVNNIIVPMMEEIKFVANLDLERQGLLDERVQQQDIDYIVDATERTDAKNHYEPSMLVDFRHGRPIELDVILGNVIKIYKLLSTDNVKSDIPYLNLLHHLLSLVQLRLKEAHH